MGTPATRPKPPVPVDSGWAWFVMFGAFLNQVALVMFARAQALLFIEFLRVYEASATATTLAFGMVPAWFAVANISVSSFFMKRFKYRTLALFGSVVHSLSITSIAFCPNIGLLGVFFALIGAAQAFIVLPQTALLGHYFKRRISFANAVASMGISIGTLTGTPFCKYLLDSYGLRGAVLLLGGFAMHSVVASMLFRPLSSYNQDSTNTSTVDETEDSVSKHELSECSHSQEKAEEIALLKEGQNGHVERLERENKHSTSDVLCPDDKSSLTQRDGTVDQLEFNKSAIVIGKLSDTHKQEEAGPNHTFGSKSSLKDLVLRPLANSNILSKSLDLLNASSSIKYMSTPNLSNSVTLYSPTIPNSKEVQQLRSPGSSDTKINELDIMPGGSRGLASLEGDSHEGSSGRRGSCLKRIIFAIHNSVLTHPVAFVLFIAGGIGSHTVTSLTYVPAVGQENGLSDDEIPFLLTVAGISDLVSKFSVGIVADLGYVQRVYIVALAQFLVGVVFQIVRFFKSFGLMLAHQVMLGYTLDVVQTLMPVLVVDFLGVDYIAPVISAFFLLMGVVHTIDHLMVGIFKDSFDSFYPGYHYFGSLDFLSAVLLLVVPLLVRCTKPVKRDNKVEKIVEEC
ncbi:uncharacterized protein LOC101853219 [Aplysia californica]|uniref:Uncharacterized protein LOC101853219 n=1 Tax=Aplysia californica TaxID=6500 RepID=A0ABM0JDI4_APLCA|nr:uncharacterized protein LOC101853219 [Aplysia californica]